VTSPRFDEHHQPAWQQFWADCAPPGENAEAFFLEWFAHGYRLPAGQTLLELLLAERGRYLPQQERAILEGWVASRPGVYQVVEIHPEHGVELHDAFRGDRLSVRDVTLSRNVVRWDVIVCRVLQTEGFYELTGLVTRLGAGSLEPLKAYASQQLAAFRLQHPRATWHDFFIGAFERLNPFLYASHFPKLHTVEGDPVCFGKAIFEVADPEAVRKRLDQAPSLESLPRDDSRPGEFEYAWLETKGQRSTSGKAQTSAASKSPGEGFTIFSELRSEAEGHRSLGRLELQPRRLTLECISRQRLERGKQLLQQLLGNLVSHKVDTFQEPEQAMAERQREPSAERPLSEAEARITAQFYQEHQQAWLDEAIPALGGLTPRQAAATAAGRLELEELLRDMENAAERAARAGRPSYDVAQIRAQLGLESLNSDEMAALDLPADLREEVDALADVLGTWSWPSAIKMRPVWLSSWCLASLRTRCWTLSARRPSDSSPALARSCPRGELSTGQPGRAPAGGAANHLPLEVC
jgi:hypothetical protein